MATAGSYDEWDDPGMAFTPEELTTWDMEAFALERVEAIRMRLGLPLRRRMELHLELPAFCGSYKKQVDGIVSWYYVALALPRSAEPDEATVAALLDPKSEEGKRLTKAAQTLSFDVSLNSWEADAEGALRRVVTIGRRCAGATSVSGWKKADKSRSNKLANCVHRELTAIEKLRKSLESRRA